MKFQIRGAEGFNSVGFFHHTTSCWYRNRRLCFSLWALLLYPSGARRSPWARWLSLCRHPGLCEANNAAVPCFSLVGDARPQFTEFVVQWLYISQQNGWKRRSKGTAFQSDSSLFPEAFPRSRGPDKGLWCGVCKQSAGIKELKVWFPMCDGGADF